MPPTGAPIYFDPLIDEMTFMASRDDLETFLQNIRVPLATSVSYGVTLKAASNGFNITVISNTDTFNLVVDGVSLGQVPTKESFVELQDAFIVLQTSYKALLTKLIAAGILVA